MVTLNINIEQKKCDAVANMLAAVLADTYLLYTKTQNFHWNVEDEDFYSLHKFFEEQYEKLAETIDELAERIRMLGKKAPGSLQRFLELTSLEESNGDLSAQEMIKTLLRDHEQCIKTHREAVARATQAGDEGSADLLIQNLRFHEKTAWMLRSHLS